MSRALSAISAVCIVLVASAGAALADRCDADAKAERFWEVEPGFRFKVKFTAQSQFCDRYSCSGHIKFISHYNYLGVRGGSSTGSHVTSYRIPKGQTSADVVDEIIPAGPVEKVKLNAIEVREVSCRTP